VRDFGIGDVEEGISMGFAMSEVDFHYYTEADGEVFVWDEGGGCFLD
jgi:hypothetical protein